MKVEFSVGIGRERKKEIVEYDNAVTDEELEQDWQDWTANYVDGGWHRLDETSD